MQYRREAKVDAVKHTMRTKRGYFDGFNAHETWMDIESAQCAIRKRVSSLLKTKKM